MKIRIGVAIVGLIAFFVPAGVSEAKPRKAMTVEDMMRFREIHHPVLSEDGRWIAYAARPDRGDGVVIVRATEGKTEYSMERGDRPSFSRDGRWVTADILPPATDEIGAGEGEDKPEKGMALLDNRSGEVVPFQGVESYAFSRDSRWLGLKKLAGGKEDEEGDAKRGSEFILYALDTGQRRILSSVYSFAFDSASHFLAYSVLDTAGHGNGLYCLDLRSASLPPRIVDFQAEGLYSNLTWNRKGLMAYLSALTNESPEPDSVSLWIWNSEEDLLVGGIPAARTLEGWIVPEVNALEWSRDGRRLFFGMKPDPGAVETQGEAEEETGLYDIEAILKKRGVDVWHWNDPWIIPNQKKRWKEEKDRFYRAVYHLASDRLVLLADEEMPDVRIPRNDRFALGSSDLPYRKLVTWDGQFRDYYAVDLETGERGSVVTRLRGRGREIQLSPGGGFVVYYRDLHWYAYDVGEGGVRNLTQGLGIPFANEDHDYPEPAPGYGIAGWMEADEAVLINDKHDVWMFDLKTGAPTNLTDGFGRRNGYSLRIQTLEEGGDGFRAGERLFLTAYQNDRKHTAVYACTPGRPGVERIVEEEKTYELLARSGETGAVLFTRESYTEFPDLWIADAEFQSRKRLTDVNPQVKEFAWGEAELVEWESADGVPLDGVLIRPGNFEKGKRYPVLVYFYRIFSDRLHAFNQVVVNHRPCFPFYASHGYAIFLPDVKFEVGLPGFSATKCIVPGVQKLIDMGIADPDAVALHGHSWSGYQTAFMVTQTDLFACAIAGAPVSNMTSAYSGIRWGTGLARQFQYEQSQSRIGGTLWDALPGFIENSPVFYADRIETPLLIMFGDEDGAVPWYQGIELYLAMRRLEKDCVFLEYRGEPHHPQKYPNKLDYTLKMMEYLDHHCKGLEPAAWITRGVPYDGK